MTWQTTPKLHAWFALVAVGLLTGLAAGRPEIIVMVAPIAVAFVAGIAADRPELHVALGVDRTRIGEGEPFTMTVTVSTVARRCEVAVLAASSPGLTVAVGEELRGVVVTAAQPRQMTVTLAAAQWGTYQVGEIWLQVRSRFALLVAEGVTSSRTTVIVYPGPEALRRTPTARHAQSAAGSHVALTSGSGLEFAGTRPAQPGDRSRDINWRATARRSGVWIYERHPERSTDVVLFLDTFTPSTLSAAVRAADSLATAYLATRDRVGLISYGGSMRWVRPGMGQRQQYLLVDALLSTTPYPSVARRDIRLVPPHVLPPRALVIALTPMDDERMLEALTDLRDRGIDLVIVEVSPVSVVPMPEDEAGRIAWRLWLMQRAQTRDEYRGHGIPVVEWTGADPLTLAIEEVRAWSRLRHHGA